MRRTMAVAFAVLAVASLAGCAGLGGGPSSGATDATTPETATGTGTGAATPTPTETTPVSTPGSDYETTTVELEAENGTQLATVEAWVADSWPKRYVGLSDTTALEPGRGMLFVHDSEGNHAYVMREMDFPLDMVFIAENGTITAIHHAPLPPEGTSGSDLERYSGRAKYVLEVPMGYTNETGIEVGDRARVGDV